MGLKSSILLITTTIICFWLKTATEINVELKYTSFKGRDICCKTGLYISNFDQGDSCRISTVSGYLKISEDLERTRHKKNLINVISNANTSKISKATALYILGEWKSIESAPFVIDLITENLISEKNKSPFYLSDASGALIKIGNEINPLLIETIKSEKDYAVKYISAIIFYKNLEGDSRTFRKSLKSSDKKLSQRSKIDIKNILKISKQWTLNEIDNAQY